MICVPRLHHHQRRPRRPRQPGVRKIASGAPMMIAQCVPMLVNPRPLMCLTLFKNSMSLTLFKNVVRMYLGRAKIVCMRIFVIVFLLGQSPPSVLPWRLREILLPNQPRFQSAIPRGSPVMIQQIISPATQLRIPRGSPLAIQPEAPT